MYILKNANMNKQESHRKDTNFQKGEMLQDTLPLSSLRNLVTKDQLGLQFGYNGARGSGYETNR